jgi:hypothetical protein
MANQPASPEQTVSSTPEQKQAFRGVRFTLVAVLMAVSANCFLKYLWWTACYSAWNGIPKLAEQWKAAGSRASFNGWSFIVLEIASITIIFALIRLRLADMPIFFKNALRLVLSLAVTIAGTGLFVWVLSWYKQGAH